MFPCLLLKCVKVKESKPLQGKEMRGPLGSNKQKINNPTLHKTDSSIIVTEARKGQSYDPLAYAVCKHRDAVIPLRTRHVHFCSEQSQLRPSWPKCH